MMGVQSRPMARGSPGRRSGPDFVSAVVGRVTLLLAHVAPGWFGSTENWRGPADTLYLPKARVL